MGVVIHVLERRTARLDVAGTVHDIGTLRRLGKATELADKETNEIDEAAKFSHGIVAAMLAQTTEVRLGYGTRALVRAHVILGWDDDRGSVSEPGWDYLPVLGYGLLDGQRGCFVLHEPDSDGLRVVDQQRAINAGLLRNGALVRQGQPQISSCSAIRSYIPTFAEADCVLSDGRHEKLLVRIVGNALPGTSWFIGRRPMDARQYDSSQSRSGNGSRA